MNRKLFSCLIFTLIVIGNSAYAESFGTIQSVSRVAGSIAIDNHKYRFDPGNIVVTYKNTTLGITYLNSGFTVKYIVDSKGFVTHIELKGPQKRIDDLFRH